MKYVMLETADGQHLPVVFPEVFTHAIVAEMVKIMLGKIHNTMSRVESAGFVDFGTQVYVHGKSESLNDLPSKEVDAARISISASVAFMPDELVTPIFATLVERAGK